MALARRAAHRSGPPATGERAMRGARLRRLDRPGVTISTRGLAGGAHQTTPPAQPYNASNNVHDDDGPLLSIPIFETEAAILSLDRPEIELEMRFGELPVLELIEHLRALAPRSVVVVPGDPVPADPWRYATAYGMILGACAALGIPTEVPRPITGNRSHH